MGTHGPRQSPASRSGPAAHEHHMYRQDAADVPPDDSATSVSRRQFLKRSLAATASASLGMAALTACAGNTLANPPQLKADFIYHNGIVLTMIPGQPSA